MRRSRLLAAGLVVLAAGGCGKRGNPLPPLRPIPARITDVTIVRTAAAVELRFTVPATNLDGTVPAAVDRIDVYALGRTPEAPAATAAVIVGDPKNLRTQLTVRRPATDGRATSTTSGPAATAQPLAPAPGERALVVDRPPDVRGDSTASEIYDYVLVPVVGTGRGRLGPFSPPVAVPIGPLPPAPPGLRLSNDEKAVLATWDAASEAGTTYRVTRTDRAGTPVGPAAVPPDPIAEAQVSLPVVFGQEVCVAVSQVRSSGAASVESPRTQPVCLTPVDRYPPPAPTGLQAVQDAAAVTLIWNGVDAPDLGGYVVLRGTGSAESLAPLMRTPIRETTFRDTTVQPGTTYVYAVYAVDTAPTPNVSQLSPRQTVTVQ